MLMNKKAKITGSFLVLIIVILALFLAGGKILNLFNNPIAALVVIVIIYALFKD